MYADRQMAWNSIRRAERIAMIIGVCALLAALIGGFFQWQGFFAGYITGIFLWIGVALGSSYLLMTHHLTGGHWGWSVRRTLESASLTLPMLAILFIPVLFGIDAIYPWTHKSLNRPDAIFHGKDIYFSVPFFIGRTAAYFLIWIALIVPLYRWSSCADRAALAGTNVRLSRLSAGGLVLMFLVISFAAVDWIASLDPEWPSTIYGMYVFVGQAMTALSLLIILICLWPELAQDPNAIGPGRLHDLGNLLLVCVILYTYMAFSQYFITWNGNLPHEIRWYVYRERPGWIWLIPVLAALHFFLPFGALLFRFNKRNRGTLLAIASVVLLARSLDTVWFVLPSFQSIGFVTALSTAMSTIGIGGIWIAAFLWHCRRRAMLNPSPFRAALEGE